MSDITGEGMIPQLSDENIGALHESTGYQFRERRWLEQSLTTRSYRNEHPSIQGDNQPLATLGDAVIRLLVMNHLFKEGVREKGELTIRSEAFVKGSALNTIGVRLGLKEYVIWGNGDIHEKVWEGERVLGEFTEALFGAIFLDGGLKACETVFIKTQLMTIDGTI